MTEEKFNYGCQQAYRALKRKYLQLLATVTEKRFYCAALSGESGYNISINSDMSVSCNCEDYSGEGHIGDLNSESLEEVFASPAAIKFRNTLAGGKLPTLKCASCSDLRIATANEAKRHAENWNICTQGIMVENTVACPYHCTACNRTLLKATRRSIHMTPENIKMVAALLHHYKIQSLSFFNLGEVFSAHDVYDQLSAIREVNPDLTIGISTNGILLNTDAKRDAAMLANHILFSIDGIDAPTLNKYQQGASFSRAYGNMKKLVAYRNLQGKDNPVIEWKYVLFNWNDRKKMIVQAVELAQNAGVDIISFWPTKSPFYGISWRYHLFSFYKTPGTATWKGIDFRILK